MWGLAAALLPLRRSLSSEAELPVEFQVVLTLLLASVLFPDVWPCGWTGVLDWLPKSWLWVPKTVASQRSPDRSKPALECPQQCPCWICRICSAMLAHPHGLVSVSLTQTPVRASLPQLSPQSRKISSCNQSQAP